MLDLVHDAYQQYNQRNFSFVRQAFAQLRLWGLMKEAQMRWPLNECTVSPYSPVALVWNIKCQSLLLHFQVDVWLNPPAATNSSIYADLGVCTIAIIVCIRYIAHIILKQKCALCYKNTQLHVIRFILGCKISWNALLELPWCNVGLTESVFCPFHSNSADISVEAVEGWDGQRRKITSLTENTEHKGTQHQWRKAQGVTESLQCSYFTLHTHFY